MMTEALMVLFTLFHLSLQEINALCFKDNIALEGTATQINTHAHYNTNFLEASRAINGDTSGRYISKSRKF